MSPTGNRFIIYCRKSTESEDRQVLSLESQKSELLKIATNNDLIVTAILEESRSAQSVGRPVFNEMVAMIASGKADGILCWKLDRLARNMIDGGQIMDMLQRGVIREIRTYEGLHRPTDNVLLLAVNFGMANQYCLDLSMNVKRGNRTKLERGEWPNHAPLGYLNDKATKLVVIDRARAPYVVKAFKLYASGVQGYASIADILYTEGFRTLAGKKVSKSNIQYILDRKFYFGVMECDGVEYPGKHKPIISKQLYDEVHAMMHNHAHPRVKKLFFPFRGIMICKNCGCAYTASLKRGHQYYYCTNGKRICTAHKKYMTNATVEKLIASTFDDLKFSTRKIDLMYRAAKTRKRDEYGIKIERRKQLQAQLDEISAKEEKLLDLFIDNSPMADAAARKAKDLHEQRTSLEEQLDNLDLLDQPSTLERTKEIFLDANKAKNDFLTGSEIKKSEIAKKVLWNISIENNSVAQIRYKKAFAIIAKSPKNAPISKLLRGLDDVRTAIKSTYFDYFAVVRSW